MRQGFHERYILTGKVIILRVCEVDINKASRDMKNMLSKGCLQAFLSHGVFDGKDHLLSKSLQLLRIQFWILIDLERLPLFLWQV